MLLLDSEAADAAQLADLATESTSNKSWSRTSTSSQKVMLTT